MAKRYRAKYSGRVYDTKEEAIRDNAEYLSDVERRYSAKSLSIKHPDEYEIPFIKSKRITLRNAGLATGAVLSENMLDTIAKYADAANLPIKTALGLATKESTLGNPTDDRSVLKIVSPENEKFFKVYGQHINEYEDAVNPRHLVNFYIDMFDPYQETRNYAKNKSIDSEGNLDEKKYRDLLLKGEKYADNKVNKYKNTFGNNNALYNAFKFYKDNPDKYNPGQKNYQELVNKRGEEVWGSPEVQSWYRRRLESRGNKFK